MDIGNNIQNFRTNLPIFGTSGLISLGLIFAGFIIALVFEKKLGWILVLGGIGFLLHLLGFF